MRDFRNHIIQRNYIRNNGSFGQNVMWEIHISANVELQYVFYRASCKTRCKARQRSSHILLSAHYMEPCKRRVSSDPAIYLFVA